MAEANRSMEEIVEVQRSVHSAPSSSHRPIGPFGPIPKNSGMEVDGTFARTPIVAGEMPRRRSTTSTVGSAAYHTVQGSGTDGSESAGYRTTSEHRDTTGAALAATDSLLPSQLAKNYKAHTYWSRSSGDSSSARGSVSAERTQRRGSAAVVTSGSSTRSEPAAASVRPRGAARREMETAEAMTYEERHSARSSGRRSSDHERYRNVSSSVTSGSGERSSFPFQRADNGAMRVTEGMVAYQDGNLAILVADPVHTRLRVQAKEKHAKSTGGSVADHMSADIHASYDNLSSVAQPRAIREVSPGRHSSAGSQRSGAAHRERFYETSEGRQETGAYTSHWEAESATHGRSDRHSSTARSSRAAGAAEGRGSRRGDGRAQSERSGYDGRAGGAGSRGSLSRRDSGFSYDPCGGSLGGSDSAGSLEDRSSSRRRDLSPRPAASARLSPATDTPATLQRVLQPAADTAAVDGHETDGFTTRFVREESAGSRRAASATTVYVAPAATGATGTTARGGAAAGAGAGAGAARSDGLGYGRAEAGVDEAGYPRRASGDWRRRSSTAELVVEDEVCDLEEREEVYSGAVKERLSRHRGDVQSSLEKSATRTRDDQQASYANERTTATGYRYSGASGGQREKRELGCLSEEAVRSGSSVQSETDCYIEVAGTEVPIVSWAVRRYSRYLQNLGRQSPRRLTLPQGSGSAAALSAAVEWCYLPAREASRLITPDNCADIYRAACALEIPELKTQCRSFMDRDEESFSRGTVTYGVSEYEDRSWQESQQEQRRRGGEEREEEEEEREEENLVVDTAAAEERPSSQIRRRRSSFGSSSPKRSYSHLYTREEQEAAVVIQSGYRGFRARRQLKDRGVELGSSRSRQLSSTAVSYSRRVSSPVSSQSRRLSSPPQRADPTSTRSVSVVFDSSGASGQGSRADVQRRSPGSTPEVRQSSRPAVSPRESQRRAGVGTERRPSASDGFSTVYEHTSRVSARPSHTASQEEGRRVSQTGSAHTSRVETRSRSPARSRSRSGSRSRVSFGGGQQASSREEHAAVVIQRNYRAFSGRFHYEEQRYAAATLQRYMRGHLARKHVREMHESAAKIQNCFREHLNEKRGRIDPEDARPVSRRVSSSSDWKCRTLLHPEGSTVLVMAGLNPMQDYCAKYNSGRDMYRYQAFQNAWEYVGQVPEPRHHASAVYLRGLVYLVGGTDPRYRDSSARCKALNTVWVLDPSTGDWWEGPPMKYARIHHGTVVAQGQLYVIGGQDEAGCALTSVELFDPDRAAWCEVAPLGCARLGTATAVHHHRIWVVGGMCPAKKQDVVTAVDIYDTLRRRWCQGPALRQARCFARLVVCAHRLFLVGGAGRTTRHQKAISSVDTVDRFEEEQKAWVHVAQMKTSRHGHAVVPESEQEFLILGGVSSQDAAALSLVEQYNARSNQWVRGVAKLPSPLSGLAAVTVLPPKRTQS